jgi:nicotinate-nucleotide pyrophosphorylase (carboxylating)
LPIWIRFIFTAPKDRHPLLTNSEKELALEHIKLAFLEDLSDEGDHSSLSSLGENAQAKAVLVAKEAGMIAGLEVAEMVFHFLDPELELQFNCLDGARIEVGMEIMHISGRATSILSAERLALNYLQRMSAIATSTHRYVDAVKGTKARILDTRKTSPGLRVFEKRAVKIGGGFNHRYGLYDMVMLKDNHIDFAGGIQSALDSCYTYLKENDLDLPVEIETRTLKDVQEVLDYGKVDRIMLDNFDLEHTRMAVDLIAGQVETESSGGITLENVRDYALCGVDFISVGALTHHIKSLDLSLKAEIS